jgi:hypothetical protein
MTFPDNNFFEEFKKTPGAISVCEAIAIFQIASQATKGGAYIDLGSHAGKAAMSAAHGIQNGSMIMVDPIYDLGNVEAFKHSIQGSPENIPWAYALEPGFKGEVKDRIMAVSDMTPALFGDYSENALKKFDQFSYVFIDSDTHEEPMIKAELDLIVNKMVPGGIIAFHDFNSEFIAVHEAHQKLIETGRFENVKIDWDAIVQFVKERDLEKGNISWHHNDVEFPCFVGAVRRI